MIKNFALRWVPPILAAVYSDKCPACAGSGKHAQYMCNLLPCGKCEGMGRVFKTRGGSA